MKDILIKLREKNRYTQTAMAKLVGVSRQAYMKYETGEVEPSIEVLRKLKEIYAVPYEVLIENNVAWLDSTPPYDLNNFNYQELIVESPSPAYGKAQNQTTVKQTIQNSSLEEFANMLFSVAANLKTEPLTLEEKLTKFEVYAKLAEAQMDIANGDKGVDVDTAFSKLMGGKWSKKHIQ